MRIRLALIAALIAGPALAAEPDELVTTAPAAATGPAVASDAAVVAPSVAAAPVTTAEQIDDFIKTSPWRAADNGDAAIDGVVAREDRKPHGEVSVSVGTGGYRSVYARTEMPVGDSARIALAFEDTRFGRNGRGYYGGPYGNPYGGLYGGGLYGGGGYSFGASMALGVTDRQRCDLEGMSQVRPLDTMGGPNGRCVRPRADW